MWHTILDIIIRIPFLPVQNKYQATRFKCKNVGKNRYIDNQKVQIVDEIKRDIWKYLLSSDVADNAWYKYVYDISSCATKTPDIDHPKAQEA